MIQYLCETELESGQSSYKGDDWMLTNQNNEAGPLPDWLSSSGLGFWEPDRLYIEWISFLYAIWEKVDYL